MIITVSKQNYTSPTNYIKVAEFYDAFHTSEFFRTLIDDARESGKEKYLVSIDFQDEDSLDD